VLADEFIESEKKIRLNTGKYFLTKKAGLFISINMW
jgi:hypothetical protein